VRARSRSSSPNSEEVGEAAPAEELLELLRAHRSRARRRPEVLPLFQVLAEAVVLRALLRIGEDLVRLGDLLELLLRLRLVLLVAVGMPLERELAERLLDLVRRGLARDAERLVVVLELHRGRGA